MKKSVVIIWLVTILTMCFLFAPAVHAENEVGANNETAAQNTGTQGPLEEMLEESKKDLAYFQNKYGSDAYGMTAYILHIISVYSIPFCFLGIAISGIYQYVIGIRKLDVKEKGLAMMVTFVTILVICQILPLAFAIVVKFGRG